MGDPLSINTKSREEIDPKRTIDKNTLVPVGVFFAACFMLFQAAAQWTTYTLKVANLEAKVASLESENKIINANIIFWRREVEKKIGPLPDFSPNKNAGITGATESIAAKPTVIASKGE